MEFEVEKNLYVGDHAANLSNYDAILSVMNDNIPYSINGLYAYLKVSAPDGPGFGVAACNICINFLRCTNGIGMKTLIHCWSGRSRSVGIASLWIALVNKLQIQEVLSRISSLRQDLENQAEWKKPNEYPFPHPVIVNTINEYLDWSNQCQK